MRFPKFWRWKGTSCFRNHFWAPSHTPYSPDFLPSDIHAFGKLKKLLWGRRFPFDDSVKAEVQKWLRELNVSLYRQGLENIIFPYDRCLNSLWTMWKNRRLMSMWFSCLHLPVFTRKKETLSDLASRACVCVYTVCQFKYYSPFYFMFSLIFIHILFNISKLNIQFSVVCIIYLF